MPEEADELEFRNSQEYEDHLLGWCGLFGPCPYCGRELDEKGPGRDLGRQE